MALVAIAGKCGIVNRSATGLFFHFVFPSQFLIVVIGLIKTTAPIFRAERTV
jgi:hypothetical protein